VRALSALQCIGSDNISPENPQIQGGHYSPRQNMILADVLETVHAYPVILGVLNYTLGTFAGTSSIFFPFQQ